MVSTRKIRAKIVEKGYTNADVAAEIGMNVSSFSQKINNKRPMTLDEAEKISTVLSISATEFPPIFFADSVALCYIEKT